MSTTNSPATPWAAPASPLTRNGIRRQASLSAAGVKSSPSTPPCRGLKREKTLLDENERLKRELEELRQLTARPGASQVQSTQPMPRGYGRSFSIRSWDAEKTGAVVAARSTDTSQPDAGVDNSLSLALPAPAEIVATGPAKQESEAPQQQLLPSWLLRRWSSSCEMQESLRDAARAGMKAEHGSRERAYEAFQRAFAVHVANRKSVHLGFSAALPLFFGDLGGSPVEICPGQLVAPALRASETKSSAFACLAEFLRQLQGAARFGDKPLARPEGMEKWEFVRELCVQAGLSLDLVRVHQAYRHHRRRQRTGQADTEHATPVIKDAVKASGERQKGRALELLTQARPESDSNPVSQAEVQSALSRAGVYLRALQVPLEQMRDLATVSAKKAQSLHRASLKNETVTAAGSQLEASPFASGADLGPLLPIADIEVLSDADEKEYAKASVRSGTDRLQQPDVAVVQIEEEASPAVVQQPDLAVVQVEEEARPAAVQLPDVAVVQVEDEARPAVAVAEDLPELPPGISRQGEVDELLIPSFGQFIDQQLLPLYVRDIPFRLLSDTLEHYCGVPVDSDDEDKALKVLDFSTKKKAAPSRSGKLKRRASEVSGDVVSMPGTPSSQGFTSLRVPPPVALPKDDPLSQLIQAVGSKPAVRSQMSNSVIEKRRTGGPALPDVAVPLPPPRVPAAPRIPSAKRPSSKRIEAAQVPARSSGTASSHPSKAKKAVATPRVSKALLVSPATEEASSKKRRLMVSPVQWRASTSFAFDRPPDENPEIVTQSASIADFSVFEEDTPWKKKRESDIF